LNGYRGIWSPDGRLAIILLDNTIRIPRTDLIKPSACEWLLRNMTAVEWIFYQGTSYIYQPACPNLPLPTEVISLAPLWRSTLSSVGSAVEPRTVLISWKGRSIVLGFILFLLGLLILGPAFLWKMRMRIRNALFSSQVSTVKR
jgi:hypothetical protein